MKTSLLVTLLLSLNLFSQQNYYTFSELKGIEGLSDNTQLFYRKYTSGYDSTVGYYYSNSIHRFNPIKKTDSLLVVDGGFSGMFNEINDYDFWKNDYRKYIYAGTDISFEGTPKVYRYNQSEPVFVSSMWGSSRNIELSRQDTNTIFYSTDLLNFKSTDWGNTWDTLDYQYQILSVSPFNDSIIFANSHFTLFKSTDGGNSFQTVDTGRIYLKNFLYDSDEIHIYALGQRSGNHLIISDNNGEPFSWVKRYSSSNPIYVSIDYSQSGRLYLADGRRIYVSEDYGLSFTEYKVLDRRIVGIYKKPNSDKLYAATKYDLYEITPDSIITLKHLPLNPDIFNWFPLQVGNKWIYNSKFLGDTGTEESTIVRKVIKTFLYNNNLYFQMSEVINFNYFIDSTSGKIYKSYFDNDTLSYQELYLDLTAEIGDTIYINQFNDGYPVFLENEEIFNQWDINSTKRNFIGQSTPLYNFSLVKDIGLSYEFWWELVGYERKLKGAVINGTIYGDTTVVAVEDEIELPNKFSLSQNYPNPFNPTTKIKYSIPNVETRHASSLLVTLKVYDILGREISTLVNEEMRPGTYEVEFNASHLSSGIYFYKLQTESYTSTRKMIYLK